MEPLILRKPAVSAALGIPVSTLERMVACGQFPKPIKLSPRTVGWPLASVQDWIDARTAQGDKANAGKENNG